MATVILSHTSTVLSDCESAWTADMGADCVATADTSVYKVGAKSAKFVIDGTETDPVNIAYITISSTNISTCTYVAMWVYSTVTRAAGDIVLQLYATGSVLKDTITLPAIPTANKWQRVIVALNDAAACTAIVVLTLRELSGKTACTLYVDDIRAVIGKAYTPDLIRGVDDLDSVEHYSLHNKYLDGSEDEKYLGFRRLVSIDFGVLTTKTDRTFLNTFFQSTDKRIFYASDEVQVVNDNSAELGSGLAEGFSEARAYALNFREKTISTSTPPSWA